MPSVGQAIETDIDWQDARKGRKVARIAPLFDKSMQRGEVFDLNSAMLLSGTSSQSCDMVLADIPSINF